MARAQSTLSRRHLLRLASAATVGGIGVILAACSGGVAPPAAQPASGEAQKPADGEAPKPTQAAQAAAPQKPAAASTTIRFITWWQPMENYLADIAKQFESSNGIAVDTEFVPSADFTPKMEAALVAGTWGDASIIQNAVQVKFMDAGLHYDMSDMIKADNIDLLSDWSLMGLEIWEGKVLCLPFDNDPRAIYYNKTAFKESGVKDPWDDQNGKWTWDDMIDAARKTTKKQGDKIVRYGLQWNYTNYQEWSPLVWTMGGNYADWKTLKYTLDDPKVLEAHKLLYKWAVEEQILITKEATTNLMGPGGPVPFRAGVAAMYHRAAYDTVLTRDAVGDKFEWDVAPFPDKDANTSGVPVTSGNPNFVPKAAKNPEAGYMWIKALMGEEVQKQFAKNHVFVPSNKKAWKTYQDNEPPKHASSFIHWVYSRPHGFHFYNAGMQKAGEAIDAELDLAYLGKQSIEDALKTAQQRANEAVNFGKAKNPFAFTVPVPAEKDLTKWGI
jgi:multiple sugar transport system substrate-binding protein